MCERPLEEKLVGQQFAGSERDAGLAVDAHHGFLVEVFYVDVSDFFNARTAVFVARLAFKESSLTIPVDLLFGISFELVSKRLLL
jgi:hypothetical protein